MWSFTYYHSIIQMLLDLRRLTLQLLYHLFTFHLSFLYSLFSNTHHNSYNIFSSNTTMHTFYHIFTLCILYQKYLQLHSWYISCLQESKYYCVYHFFNLIVISLLVLHLLFWNCFAYFLIFNLHYLYYYNHGVDYHQYVNTRCFTGC